MGSRKDLIKRHLGITEYPWSSDDELEGATHAAEESSLRRQAAEICPPIPDAPGTSGDPPQPMPPMVPQQQQHQPSQLQQQQQQHQQQHHQQQHHQQQLDQHRHHHQQQERIDHQLQQLQLQQQQLHQQVNATWHQARVDLCRSIANSAPRSHRMSAHSSRVQAGEMPMSYVSRVNHVPAPELSEHSAERSEADIQRMIAFKRLTRNLGSLRHRAHIAGVIPVTRVNPGVIVPSEANSSFRSNRHIPIRRYLRIGPYGPLPLRSGYMSSSPPDDRPTPMGTLQNRPGQNEHDELIDEDHPILPQPQPPIPGPSTEDEVNNNPIPMPATADLVVSDDGNVVLDVQMQQELDAEESANHSSANATLQDEIDAMAFDNGEVTAPVSTVDEEEEATDRRAESSTEDAAGPSGAHFSMALHGSGNDRNLPSTSSETVDAEPQQPPRHGVKRRRDDVDIRLDAFSVQEFNQNLLRLLECPVCLDWMEPPMSQCQRGHLVCGRCRARLSACPVCRTSFSSVRNRAMEGVAEMLRYPCRHGCGREVRLRRRATHESSCASRKYQCPAPICVGAVPMPREMLPHHFQSSLEEDNASRPDVEQPAPPSQDNGPSQPSEVERPYLGALHIQAMNVADESSLPEEILLESQSDELPSDPSTSQDYSGQIQQPASPGMPYLEALRGHMLNVANQPPMEEENPSQRDIEPPNPPTQNVEPIEPHEVESPYLGALRIQAMNAANESPLLEESLLESYSDEQPPQPSTSQNGGGQLQQHVSAGMPYLEALHGHMLHIANESPRLPLDFLQHGRRHILPRNVGLPLEFQSWDSTRQYLQSLGIRALNQVNENLHLTMMRIGRHHKFSMKVNAEQHDNWIIFAMEEYFHLRINVDIRTWGVIAYASYIGPKCEANNYTYEVTVEGRANQRKLSYVRTTHSDLESSSLNVCRQDCFHLTLDQALHFIRFKNHTEKYIDFNVVISRVEQPVAAEAAREESHS